jgi:hypothetical protein
MLLHLRSIRFAFAAFAFASAGVNATDYYAAYGAPPTDPCTDPEAPCDLGYAISSASGPDIRIHIAASPSHYPPQHVDGTVSMTLIGAGSLQTTIGSGGYDGPDCAITLATATVVLEDLALGNDLPTGVGVCLVVPDGGSGSVSLFRTNVAMPPEGSGIGVSTTGTGTATVHVVDSVLTQNGGGGIVFGGNGSINVERSLFYHNDSYLPADQFTYNSPIDVYGTVTTTVTNSTFTLNLVYGVGAVVGGIRTNGTLILNNDTFSGNYGWAVSAGVASIMHTMIDGGCFALAGVYSGDYSVESPGNTCSLSGTSLINVSNSSLALTALADNGGFTQTLLPQPASVAIGLGGPGCEQVDQRDFVRTTACDAGAVQADATPPDKIFDSGFEGT